MAIISSWIPPAERSLSVALIWGGIFFPNMYIFSIIIKNRAYITLFIFLGGQFGTVVSLSLSGYLADELGWEWDFYFFGMLGLVFCCFWMILIHSSPSRHPKISKVFFTKLFIS